jgi:hypothetical protein
MERQVDYDAPGRQTWAENVAGLDKIYGKLPPGTRHALSPHDDGTKVNAPCLRIVTAVCRTSDSVP